MAAHAQGITKGEKRKQMKMEGSEKDFKSVQEREKELIQSADPSHRPQLQTWCKSLRMSSRDAT